MENRQCYIKKMPEKRARSSRLPRGMSLHNAEGEDSIDVTNEMGYNDAEVGCKEVSDMFYDVADLKDGEITLRLDRTCDEQPEKRWLPAYYFSICLSDGTPIGKCDLRIGHNDKTYIGGNIGYSVEKEYRGHHYAAKACALLFRQARKHGMDHLIITCDPANAASYKTCERAGGTYLETADIPEDNEMYAEGKRQVMIYRFTL